LQAVDDDSRIFLENQPESQPPDGRPDAIFKIVMRYLDTPNGDLGPPRRGSLSFV